MQGEYVEITGKTGRTRIINNVPYYGALVIEQGDNKIWLHPDDVEDFIDGIKKLIADVI